MEEKRSTPPFEPVFCGYAAEAGHGVVRIAVDGDPHMLLRLVEQADMGEDHGQLVVGFVRTGVEFKRPAERPDGALVRKALGPRPQDEATREVRFGEIGIQVKGFLERDFGTLVELLTFGVRTELEGPRVVCTRKVGEGFGEVRIEDYCRFEQLDGVASSIAIQVRVAPLAVGLVVDGDCPLRLRIQSIDETDRRYRSAGVS